MSPSMPVVGARQATSPNRSRRGTASRRLLRLLITLATEPCWRKVAKIRASRSRTSRSGVLGDAAVGIAHETGRQLQRQLAAGGLAQQAGGEAAAQQVKLDLRHGALEPPPESPVERSRVVHAVAVGGEARPLASQVEQPLPR